MTVDRVGKKVAETSKTDVLPDTCCAVSTYRGADKSLARSGRKKLMFLSEWREFPSAPYLAGGKKNLMTARVSMLLKSRASLIRFPACFLPGRARAFSAPQYIQPPSYLPITKHVYNESK